MRTSNKGLNIRPHHPHYWANFHNVRVRTDWYCGIQAKERLGEAMDKILATWIRNDSGVKHPKSLTVEISTWPQSHWPQNDCWNKHGRAGLFKRLSVAIRKQPAPQIDIQWHSEWLFLTEAPDKSAEEKKKEFSRRWDRHDRVIRPACPAGCTHRAGTRSIFA